MAASFKTVVPTRTFLEKMFLLHEEFQKERPRSLRMSRHLYDLERLMDTAYGKDALAGKKLYETIVKHRETFNRLDGIDYALHSPETIDFIPPKHLINDWKQDYNALSDSHIYDRNRIPSERLMARMAELLTRVRNMAG